MRKSSKEFLGVIISVLVCVFIVGLAVYATTTIGDPITVGTDLTVTSGARIGTGATPGHITALADDSLFIEGDLEIDGTAWFDGTASVSSTLEALTLKANTLASSSGTLTINAFTLGGTIEGNGNDIISLGLITATELSVAGTASISEDLWASGSFQFGGGEGIATASYSRLGGTDTGHDLSNANDLVINGSLEVDGTAYFDSTVSVSSSGLLLDEGIAITTGTASASGDCGTAGSLYIRSGQASIDSVLSVCGSDGAWNPADL